ncbi:MAG TPA: MBOAT family O-acyltransferase [Leadbetterella sp.]|nr:MBOAT family O-acyltransferase [Leadbetterella sp.]
MLFNSFEFLIFFPLVTFLFFVFPYRFRWMLLLAASCAFYAFFKWEYIFILLFTIIIDYFAGIWIDKTRGSTRKWALAVSLVANIGVLALFKYYYFILDNFNAVSYKINQTYYDPLWKFILPIGLSFHTFQAMSYTIEVYRGNQKVETNFGIYALYVMFYPQLVAGPIERPQNVLYQFYEKFDFDYDRVKSGLRLMLWGMFKKVVIADNLSVFVDQVYGDLNRYQGLPLLIATLFYSIQIFCDFSGYSDIALGSARVMGFKLMKNFDRPYSAKSISEFWKRWHISLSTWFRDYLYIPLGGNRVSTSRKYFNLFFVFMVSGLWHGASWNFVIWGALHGFYQIIGQLTKNIQSKFFGLFGEKLSGILQNLVTVILVVFAWIFFRATKFADAKYVLKNIFKASSHSFQDIVKLIGAQNLIVVLSGILILEIVQWMQSKRDMGTWVENRPTWQRWSIYYFFLLFILTYGYFGEVQFIYFQF